MAAVYPTNNVLPNPPPPTEAPQGISSRYVGRPYQPYVFQPNFLKQQIRQRELEKAVRLGQVDEANAVLGKGPILNTSSTSALVTSLIEEAGRKKSGRKVIDWASSCALYLERRRWQREFIDIPALLPDPSYSIEMQAPMAYRESSAYSVATKFVRSATNKMKCPVYKVVWTPDGRRLVTGSASGEFTLWNGTAFNFETILQAHDSPVRAMTWSHFDAWLITGDNQGYIKYWQLNMNNVKMYQAHKDQACRSVCFNPTDAKFVTASDDGTVRVWDFLRCREEHILRGHGSDVKQVDWHPQKSLIVSASKDLHTPVKLWDPKAGQSLATIHAHKGTVMDVKFNRNGNWFLSASRDHLVKLYDIRNLKEEIQVFRGHKKEAFSVAWHPVHEDMFASGGSEGSIIFWQVGEEKEVGGLEGAHDSLIWSLAWHPLGHILVSGSNDHSTKFWTRNRPGDQMRDRYNLFPNADDNLASKKTTAKPDTETPTSEAPSIPGMGDADAAAADVAKREEEEQKTGIPGLDWSFEEKSEFQRKMLVQQENSKKKGHYSRPVPRSFAAAWESNKEGAPRRPRSRTPSPPRDRFDEPPPPWHKEREDRLLPRFHPGPPPHDPGRHPTDYPPEDMRPADIPHHMDPALPPDVHPHAMEPRTFAREGEPEFVPGVTSEVPYRGADPGPRGIRGVDPGPRGLRGAEPAPRGVPEERREFHEPPEMAVDPEEHDLIVEYPGPDNHVNKRDHARGPVRNRPPPDDYPRMQSDHPGPLKEYPGMGDRGNNLNNWTKEIDREALLREDQFYADLYNRNLDPAFDEMADDQPMAYDIVDHPLPFRGPERGMPRGRPRAMRRGRVMPLRGRGWRGGGPWNPGDGPARGRPPPGMRPPMRMRRGRRVMID